MGRGDYFESRKQVQRRVIHPIWRGIGCILLVVIPLMSYAGATLLVDANMTQGWYPVPPEMARTVTLPLVGSVSHLYANLLVAFVLLFLGYALLVIIYSIVYASARPRYGPYDAPPIRRRRRKRR